MTRRVLFAFSAIFAAMAGYGLVNLGRTLESALPVSFVLFGVAPILSGLSLLLALRGNPQIQARGVYVLLGCFGVAYGAELVLPLYEHLVALRWLAAHGSSPVDRREKAQVIADARAAGVNWVSAVEPKAFLQLRPEGEYRSRLSDGGAELLPLSGVAHQVTVVCNEMGEWITYESDRFGMNNPDAVWEPDRVDLAVVGDAFANGWCSNPDQHFVGLIAADRSRVVNLGQSGNGPLLTLGSMVEYLREVRPPTVLWFHYELNDFEDLETERRSSLLRGYLDGSTDQRLIARQEAVDRHVGRYLRDTDGWASSGKLVVDGLRLRPRREAVKAFIKLSHLRQWLGATYANPFEADHDLWARVVARANVTVQSWDGQLIVVYLPAAKRYEASAARVRAQRTAERVLADLDSLGVRWVNPTVAFDAQEDPAQLFNPIAGGGRGHYTPEAHRHVADAVLEALKTFEKNPPPEGASQLGGP